jgi:hypothetical protein
LLGKFNWPPQPIAQKKPFPYTRAISFILPDDAHTGPGAHAEYCWTNRKAHAFSMRSRCTARSPRAPWG